MISAFKSSFNDILSRSFKCNYIMLLLNCIVEK
nr:MAG TPA: hypothetical protein [Caudoviricetes sp.]